MKNVAHKHGKTVTFMPKPLFEDNGTGMHTHQSIWRGDEPLFAGSGYAGLSETALHYIGGILKHADALIALTNPTTNSFKRLVPGYEAPVNLAYSLADALNALEEDHDFLLKGDVFTDDVIEEWVNYKRENEVDAVNQRPHPHEFALYFDV